MTAVSLIKKSYGNMRQETTVFITIKTVAHLSDKVIDIFDNCIDRLTVSNGLINLKGLLI